jgi:antitoxin component YwqK of YwqJK toxin-antitoxin module
METRSRKRIFSLVDSDIPKNVSVKIQKKNIEDTNIAVKSKEPMIVQKPIMNEENEKEKEKEDCLTQYVSNKISFEEFFELTKVTKGFIYQEGSKLNNNMHEDIPISLQSYYYTIMNIVTNNKNLVKIFNNIKDCDDFLKSSQIKYFVLCENNQDNHIHKIYRLDENIAKFMYFSKNINIRQLITLNGSNETFSFSTTYRLNKNITLKDIYLFSYSQFDKNSIFMTQKVKLIDDFYSSFDIDKNKLFTRIEIYDFFVNYVKDNNLISKFQKDYVVIDSKLGKLFNLCNPIQFNIFKKIIRQIIILNNSIEYVNYIFNNNFSDFKIHRSYYVFNNKKNGLYRQYNKNGKLVLELFFVNDMREGISRKWDDNGNLRSIIEYHNNKKNGTQKIYDENSCIVAEFTFQENNMINYHISERYN